MYVKASVFTGAWLTSCAQVLWSWFPIGPAGLRAFLLFISGLVVFVLRVAQLHFGARTSDSSFQTFRHYLLRCEPLQTLGCYFFSAWLFSEIYVWSVPARADLSWVAEGKYVNIIMVLHGKLLIVIDHMNGNDSTKDQSTFEAYSSY